MSFNPLEYLKQGNTDFLYNMTTYDLNSICEQVRISEDRLLIIENILPKIKDNYSSFCLKLIYDIDIYEKETRRLLLKKEIKLTESELINLVKKTKWGMYYIIEHVSSIFERISNETINIIFYYLIKDHSDKAFIFKY